MIDSDKIRFINNMNDVMANYHESFMSEQMLNFFIQHIEQYPIQSILSALDHHVRTSPFPPKINDIINYIEGAKITPAELLIIVGKKITVLGMLAGKLITTSDLQSKSRKDLLLMAESALFHLPEWQRKAKNCDYTDHEIIVGIDKNIEFSEGLYNETCIPDKETFDWFFKTRMKPVYVKLEARKKIQGQIEEPENKKNKENAAGIKKIKDILQQDKPIESKKI